jgi:hypothetical protein
MMRNKNSFNLILILMIIVVLIMIEIKKDKFNGLDNNNMTININKDDECILIKKKLAKDGSGFYYENKKTNCDLNNPNNLNHNLNDKRLLPKNTDVNTLGSCRKDSHECFDFFTKEKCDKFERMIWNKVPCNMPINYVNKVEPYKIFNISDIQIKKPE